MADFVKVIKGVLAFVFGFIYTVVSWYTMPILLSIGDTDGTGIDPTMKAIFYFGLFVTWILAVIVAPAYFIIDGMKEQ